MRPSLWYLLLFAVPSSPLSQQPPCIGVCQNKSCRLARSRDTLNIFRDFTTSTTLVSVEESGCVGSCGAGPNVISSASGRVFNDVAKPGTVAAILAIEADVDIPDSIVSAYTSAAAGMECSGEAAIERFDDALRIAASELVNFPAVEATLRFHRAEALTAAALSCDSAVAASPLMRQATIEALRVVRLEGARPRSWWALKDAFKASGRRRSELDALFGLLRNVQDGAVQEAGEQLANRGARNSAKEEAQRLCAVDGGLGNHPVCHLLSS